MVAPQGYNITCDPGDLFNRKCYTTNASGEKEEIVGYQNGNPVSKAKSSSSWIAWVPTLTTLNQDGTAYQPYGEAGIPYLLGGGSAIGAYMPSSGADMQDYYYLNEVMPGSQARKMYNERTCSPLWNTFGCKTGDEIAPTTKESAKNKSLFKKIFGSEAFTSQKWVPPVVGGVITLVFILAYKKLV